MPEQFDIRFPVERNYNACLRMLCLSSKKTFRKTRRICKVSGFNQEIAAMMPPAIAPPAAPMSMPKVAPGKPRVTPPMKVQKTDNQKEGKSYIATTIHL